MAEFDAATFVARLEHMGVRLTAVPLADGKLRINRWRMLHAVDNTSQIQDLWTNELGDDQARIDTLAAYLDGRNATPRVTTERVTVALKRAQ
jgi:hypothetical protein